MYFTYSTTNCSGSCCGTSVLLIISGCFHGNLDNLEISKLQVLIKHYLQDGPKFSLLVFSLAFNNY